MHGATVRFIFLSIFILTSLHVHPVCVAVWSAGLKTRQPPIQNEKYQCCIETVSSPDDGHTVARNM